MDWKQKIMMTPLYDWFGKRSFAQSGEDIVADLELGRKKIGVYVDVGAYHPKLFSNTYLFYKKGWRGICVDPNPEVGKMFGVVRPRDIFVNYGVGEDTKLKNSKIQKLKTKGINKSRVGKGGSMMEYFMFEDGAVNTFSEEQLKKNQKVGRKLIGTIKLEIMSLKNILDKYLPKGEKIDLLSVDVEGMDLEVLKSNDWKKYRPTVIICEDLNFDLDKYRGWIPDQVGNDKNEGVVGYLSGIGYGLKAVTPYSLVFKLR